MIDAVSWRLTGGEIIRASRSDITNYHGQLRLIDQTLLPEKLVYVESADTEVIYDWIKRLVVRGAPAIGCAAGLGLAASMFAAHASSITEFMTIAKKNAARLAESRPTAVNLFWALNRCLDRLRKTAATTVTELENALIHEALEILDEDIRMCRSIGQHGVELVKNGMGILTHCNAGALATGDYGTALSPMYCAHEKSIAFTVYSDETRPLLQGSRLTAWELQKAGINVVTICDNMAAQVMKEGKIQMVIVGADRIAANGDAANKIGTYGVAILAKYHGVPFYVAAPYSTIDISLPDGSGIPIEQRDGNEIRRGCGKLTAPPDVKVYNPAFDVTPHELITGIITERGILTPPFDQAIRTLFS